MYKSGFGNHISFHMPGHKGKKFFPDDLTKFDTTEIDGTDNLYAPRGIIQAAQEHAAEVYGAGHTIFLTNGATAGIVSAILALSDERGVIIVARNCHKSVFSGIILSGAYPFYVYPKMYGDFAGSVAPLDIEQAILKNKDKRISAVALTSPTYEGITSDIKKILEITNRYGIPLIVDEAHGAHFPFSPDFPQNSAAVGADIVINSMHKTLPVFGQSALLHINAPKLVPKIMACLELTQTSSPSYLLMCAMDKFFEDYKAYDFGEYSRNLQDTRAVLKECKNIRLLENDDLSRLVFLAKDMGNFGNTLRDKYNVEIEGSFDGHAIAISTISDSIEDLRTLQNAVLETDRLYAPKEQKTAEYARTDTVISPRKAFFGKRRVVPIEHAAGEICAENIMLCPPAIPIIAAGEIITESIIANIPPILREINVTEEKYVK
ncbi:arginine decarboxylase [Clostridia bacterium]|nr:arginine decarboxylase [Clostridia bacterium]